MMVDVLAKVGGFDLLGMTGVMQARPPGGLPVVLDGFPSPRSGAGSVPELRRR